MTVSLTSPTLSSNLGIASAPPWLARLPEGAKRQSHIAAIVRSLGASVRALSQTAIGLIEDVNRAKSILTRTKAHWAQHEANPIAVEELAAAQEDLDQTQTALDMVNAELAPKQAAWGSWKSLYDATKAALAGAGKVKPARVEELPYPETLASLAAVNAAIERTEAALPPQVDAEAAEHAKVDALAERGRLHVKVGVRKVYGRNQDTEVADVHTEYPLHKRVGVRNGALDFDVGFGSNIIGTPGYDPAGIDSAALVTFLLREEIKEAVSAELALAYETLGDSSEILTDEAKRQTLDRLAKDKAQAELRVAAAFWALVWAGEAVEAPIGLSGLALLGLVAK